MSQDLTTSQLVERVVARDRQAAREIYARFHRAVHAVVLSKVNPQDCDDLVQDVFGKAFADIGSLRELAAFPGWLMAIARNTAIAFLRKRREQPSADAAEKLTSQQSASANLDAARVLQAIRTLPEAYQETLLMRLVEDLTGPEIAERTGLAPGSVRVNLHRGMELLRAALHPTTSPQSPTIAGDQL